MNTKNVEAAIQEIYAKISDQQAALNYIYDLRVQSGTLRCPKCGGKPVDRVDEREVRCGCGNVFSFTALTPFHKVRRVREAIVIIILRELGFELTSSGLAKLLGMSQSGVWIQLRKLGIIVKDSLADLAIFAKCEELVTIIARRSRETPADVHPAAPLLSQGNDRSQDEIDTLPPAKKQICEALLDGPVHQDTLQEHSSLSEQEFSMELLELQLAGIVRPMSGARYELAAPKPRSSPNEADDPKAELRQMLRAQFVTSCRSNQQTVSRKHLQLHLFDFDLVLNKSRWAGGILLNAVLSHPPISYWDIVNYSSPPALVFSDELVVTS